ncbi:MAG: inositol monophosphatase family protein [Ilumatobacter sp.]|uniref:inositol monophosphatase family protein n=1 Tax=Ilumatobacter sp. TaxID=1967498 RepID=UPI00391B787A
MALAIRAALAGASIGLSYFDRVGALDQDQKADGSIVTEADLAVEREVRRVIATARPSDAFIGEETGVAGSSNRRWILDGIDGTLVFVLGDDRWQSLIALEIDGLVEVGVAIVPSQAEVWFAQRGAGAFRQSFDSSGLIGEAKQLRTSGRTSLNGCEAGYLPPLHMVPRGVFAEVAPLLDRTAPSDWSAHAALLVASGDLDAAIQVGGKLWDYAPLGLIVTETAGAFSGADGTTHPVEGAGLFAATNELLDAVRFAIADAHQR